MDPQKPHKVLVVEDEGLIALDISTRLRAMGHEVVATVGTAAEAMEKASEADIVLMDIRIDGDTDGVEAATAIRNGYHVPVVFLTAHADRATLDRAKSAGPFGYIVKPLAHASLNTSIEIALYKHGMERRLEEREAWLTAILSAAGDAVIAAGANGRVLMLNRAAETLTGWTEAQAKGQPISKVVRLLDRNSGAETADPVMLAILRDERVAVERSWRLISRGGREMQVEGSAAPVKAPGNTPAAQMLGAVLTLRDVSAREWEERQLRQSQKLEAVGRLAAGVSNEYSDLLASIRYQAGQLLRQFGEYSPARQAAEEIERAACAAEQMSQRLATFGTRQVSHPEVLSLNAILRRATRWIESVTGPTVEMNMRLDPATARIKADKAQIEQAIMTQILRACATMSRNTPPGGRLLIETGNAEVPVQGRAMPHAMLAITYTGSEADPEKLFEPSSSGQEGLALSLAHAAIAEHAGFISAREIAGEVCRLETMLPAVSGAAPLPQPFNAAAPAILLVEDRESVRLQLHNFFEANGYNLLEAADAGEAVAVSEMHEGSLDLLIASAAQADSVAAVLRGAHPGLRVLHVVDRLEANASEIGWPFAQQTLLERVESILNLNGSRAQPMPTGS